jgi:hypothetical protein
MRTQATTTLAVWRFSHEHRKQPQNDQLYRSSFPWPQRQQLDHCTRQLMDVVLLKATNIAYDNIALNFKS